MIDELGVAGEHGLFWAGSQAVDAEGKLLADGSYIYQPVRFPNTFFLLFDKLRQLNDYCFHQLLSSQARLDELAVQRSAAITGEGGAEEFIYLSDQIPLWEDNVQVVAKSTSVVLLCSFMEWGLKLVAKELCGGIPRKSDRSMSDIEFMLWHIEQRGGLQLVVDDEPIGVVNSFRVIRNAFAHGDWTELNEQLDAVSLRVCFESVSEIFQRIEEAAWRSPWGVISP